MVTERSKGKETQTKPNTTQRVSCRRLATPSRPGSHHVDLYVPGASPSAARMEGDPAEARLSDRTCADGSVR